MNRYQIRSEVRRIIRDSDYPKQDIDRAINSVVSTLNSLGRFRFNETFHDITLVNADKDYTMANFVSETAVVLQPDTVDEVILTKVVNLTAAYERGWFVVPGDSPAYYAVFGDQMLFEPIPNIVAAGKIVRVHGYYNLPIFDNDLTESDLPNKYCTSVLAWGSAAEINPSLAVDNDPRGASIRDIFMTNIKAMLAMEGFEAKIQYGIQKDHRWSGLSTMGHVNRVRG